MRDERHINEEYATVTLPNHRRDEFEDILASYAGDFPIAFTYTVPPATDAVPDEGIESEDWLVEGFKTQAWIDLSGKNAKVKLDMNAYAHTPPEEMTEEAERVLVEWAQAVRRTMQGGVPADVEEF